MLLAVSSFLHHPFHLFCIQSAKPLLWTWHSQCKLMWTPKLGTVSCPIKKFFLKWTSLCFAVLIFCLSVGWSCSTSLFYIMASCLAVLSFQRDNLGNSGASVHTFSDFKSLILEQCLTVGRDFKSSFGVFNSESTLLGAECYCSSALAMPWSHIYSTVAIFCCSKCSFAAVRAGHGNILQQLWLTGKSRLF